MAAAAKAAAAKAAAAKDLGPVDYLVVAFPGNKFSGAIAPELRKLVTSGVVRIIDLTFVKKDAEGTVTVMELESLEPEEARVFADIDGEIGGLLSEEDLTLIAEEIPPDCSAALIVWENTWAAALAQRIREADGIVVAHERVPASVVEQDLLAIAR
ncbi:DUF6325 family protein [Streptacidiphilus sp. EB129]|uniref:DUF6325 family protein n=1 Tax=Streptacidiphilus sp. EB129 TaxID=3156262 RepID=UPI0035166182